MFLANLCSKHGDRTNPDTAWVESTLVRLALVGVTNGMAHSHQYLVDTLRPLRTPEHNVWIGDCKREPFNTVCIRQITPQVVSSFVVVANGHSYCVWGSLIRPLLTALDSKTRTPLPAASSAWPWHLGTLVSFSWSITHAGSKNSLALDQKALQAHNDVAWCGTNT